MFKCVDGNQYPPCTVSERLRLVQEADRNGGEYIPEQQAEPACAAVGCAVCARYSVWGVERSHCRSAPAKARRREGRVNRGGTA